ncbi:class I SAM-dependent methyltransferase, partial [Cetobacterium sp.]
MSVEFYNNNAEEFFNNTVNADMSATYSLFEENLCDIDGEILDLGCGSGRDAKHFIDKGYKVTALDLSPVLAAKASKYIGQQVIVGDMKDLDYNDKFIGIWACASLLHLTEDEVLETIKRCHKALKKDGVL